VGGFSEVCGCRCSWTEANLTKKNQCNVQQKTPRNKLYLKIFAQIIRLATNFILNKDLILTFSK
jgi:hypothetical protein